ncbi:MAG: hypothetical protein ISS66_17865 [Desulfobacteraceae bacterium]|nr:hypothetical protein [Desulfobacteraceae bacterium]
MKYEIITILIICLIIFNSCELFDTDENLEIPDWYPSQLVVSENRFLEYDTIATYFADTFDLNKNNFVIDSLTAHVYKIYSPNIKICTFSDSTDHFFEFKQEVTHFFDTWYRMVSMEYFEIDTMDYTESDNGYHGADIYIKSNYILPLYDGARLLGSIGVWMNGSGIITKIRSTLLPQLRIPEENIITLKEAKNILEGYKYSVYSWSGKSEREFSITGIESTGLEVYIYKNYENNGSVSSINYRLVWRITSFDGDFFVDSQTGEIVGFIQGWRS